MTRNTSLIHMKDEDLMIVSQFLLAKSFIDTARDLAHSSPFWSSDPWTSTAWTTTENQERLKGCPEFKCYQKGIKDKVFPRMAQRIGDEQKKAILDPARDS